MINFDLLCLMILLVSTTPSLATTDSSFHYPLPPLPPPPRSLPPPRTTLKPSMAVIVELLTTMFSNTFLLLLYTKHCRRPKGYSPVGEGMVLAGFERKNSGINMTIIKSLPVFRFRSLSGQKYGLECAVCLNRFDPSVSDRHFSVGERGLAIINFEGITNGFLILSKNVGLQLLMQNCFSLQMILFLKMKMKMNI